MIVVTGSEPNMQVQLVTRNGNHYSREILFETVIPMLENVSQPDAFAL